MSGQDQGRKPAATPAYSSPYRRPVVSYADHRAEIEEFLDLAVGTVAAMRLSEPDQVVDHWNTRMWEALRKLTPEQRIEVIVVLAQPWIQYRVDLFLTDVL